MAAGRLVGIAHQIVRALARVAARQVLADGRTVAGMVPTLVNVDAVQLAVVLKTGFTATSSHSLLDETRSMRATVHSVAGVLADEVDALSVEGAVGVVKALHSLAAGLVVEGIAGEEAYFRALALHLMILNAAHCMRSTRAQGAEVDAPGDALLVTSTGSIRRTVHIATRTFTRILTPSPAVADFALLARASIASWNVLADGRRMTGLGGALVQI